MEMRSVKLINWPFMTIKHKYPHLFVKSSEYMNQDRIAGVRFQKRGIDGPFVCHASEDHSYITPVVEIIPHRLGPIIHTGQPPHPLSIGHKTGSHTILF